MNNDTFAPKLVLRHILNYYLNLPISLFIMYPNFGVHFYWSFQTYNYINI